MTVSEAVGFSRRQMSPATRDVLIQIASGDLNSAWPKAAEDWDEILIGVYLNGLLGLTERYRFYGIDRDHLPPHFRGEIDRAGTIVRLHMRAMSRWIAAVVGQLSAAGVQSIVLKGPALSWSVYPDASLRAFGDLDLMVRERDMVAAHAALVEMGLDAERDLSRVPPKLTSWCTTYEARYVDPADGFVIEVHYDDLLHAGLVSRDISGFWDRAVTINAGGVDTRILSIEDQLIHLCCHMHYHGYTKLIWFSDLVFLLQHGEDRLDWDRLLHTTRVEAAETPVYYSLYFLVQLFGTGAPAEVLAALKPGRLRARLHDHFMPPDRVRSLEPMPRPDFSFYFLPLFKRLLPDLFVMGRHREKLHYLLRLVAPPADWMRDYYRLKAGQRLAGYYLSHPLRLLRHYLMEVAATVRSPGPWWSGER